MVIANNNNVSNQIEFTKDFTLPEMDKINEASIVLVQCINKLGQWWAREREKPI